MSGGSQLMTCLARALGPMQLSTSCHAPLICRRKVYDQTGSVEDSEELAGQQFNDLYNYYRSMFAKVGP